MRQSSATKLQDVLESAVNNQHFSLQYSTNGGKTWQRATAKIRAIEEHQLDSDYSLDGVYIQNQKGERLLVHIKRVGRHNKVFLYPNKPICVRKARVS